jgi:hypothetical protein
VAFNVDPLFNNAVDGLMYIELLIFQESTMKPGRISAGIREKISRKGRLISNYIKTVTSNRQIMVTLKFVAKKIPKSD